MFTIRVMKSYPLAQKLEFFGVELRVPWLTAARRGGDWLD
jgi:hypothetical protein